MTIRPARLVPPVAPARVQRRGKRIAASGEGPGRNLAESPVAWLFTRRDADGNTLISEAQFKAGEKLRADFWFAQMTPNVTQSWSATAAPGGRRAAPGSEADMRDGVIAAAERVRRALAAVGPEHAGILFDVCCHLTGLEHVERTSGWPRRSAKVVLTLALTALARHYGFEAEARQPRAANVRHWGADGYRPALDNEAD